MDHTVLPPRNKNKPYNVTLTLTEAQLSWARHWRICEECQDHLAYGGKTKRCEVGKAIFARKEKILAEKREKIRDSLICRLKEDGYTED